MQIDILHIADCPNLSTARTRVYEAIDAVGAAVRVSEVEVATLDEAQRRKMRGSPTILVDGHDPFGAPSPPSLSCRLYRTDVALEGAPSVAQLVEVLGR